MINYNTDIIRQSIAALDRLYNCRDALQFALEHAAGEADDHQQQLDTLLAGRLEECRAAFVAAMEDDLNTADAIAALFELVRTVNVYLGDGSPTAAACEKANALFGELTGVLGLLYERRQDALDAEIEEMIAARTEARKQKNWAESDRIRDQLKAMNIVLEDTPQGVKWHRA